MDGPHDDPARDRWLQQALRHAPDADAAPPAGVRQAILRQARHAVRPARPWNAVFGWLTRPLPATALASFALAATVITMWRESGVDPLQPADSVAPAPAAAPVPAPTPAPPQAPAPEPQKASKAVVPALPSGVPVLPKAAAPVPAARAPALSSPAPAAPARQREPVFESAPSAALRAPLAASLAPETFDPLTLPSRRLAQGQAQWRLPDGRSLDHGGDQRAWLQQLEQWAAGRWVLADRPAGKGLVRLEIRHAGASIGALDFEAGRVTWTDATGSTWVAELPAGEAARLAAEAGAW